MTSRILPAAMVLGLMTAPGFASTICSADTMAGIWIGGDMHSTCRLNFQENGRVRGFCNDYDEYWHDGQWYYVVERAAIRGGYTLDAECSIRVRVNAEFENGETDRVILHGRVTSSAGTAPDMAIFSMGPRADFALNLTFHRD